MSLWETIEGLSFPQFFFVCIFLVWLLLWGVVAGIIIIEKIQDRKYGNKRKNEA